MKRFKISGMIIVGILILTYQIVIAGDLINNELVIGSGKITGSVINNGTISPGNLTGTIEITDNFTANSGSVLNIDIASNTDFDRISIGGTAILNGDINVNLLNNFVPSAGNTFTILQFNSKTGDVNFPNLPSLPNGYSWQINRNLTNISLSINSPALPLTILNFTGKNINNESNQLNWQVTEAKNSSHFEIEKSKNGIEFHEIGKINAINSKEKIGYEFIDLGLFYNINYYKLKIIDLNGKYEYSKIISINVSDKTEYIVYPNPAKNEVNIITESEKSEISIFSSDGRFIEMKNGKNIVLDIKYYASGSYNIQISSKDGLKNMKFIKQ